MRKLTSKDVAKLAGCSQTTVSFVLNNKQDISISDETRQKVLEAAKELNYVPNQFAKGLKTNKSNLIGLIVPNMINPYFPSIIQKFEEYAATKGYNIITCNSHRQPERERIQHDLLIEKSVDGIIYTFTPQHPENIQNLSGRTKLIVFGEFDPDCDLNMICYDGYTEGQQLVEHLISLGHRKICYITPPFSKSFRSRERRLNGIIDKMKEYGCQDDLIVRIASSNTHMSETPFEFEIGYNLTEEVLNKTKVTAIIGMNDMIALGAMDYIFNNTKYSIPGDISLCGFDDIYLGNMFHPKLTTVNHNLTAGCQLTVDKLLDLIENSHRQSQVIKIDYLSKIVVRDSVSEAKV